MSNRARMFTAAIGVTFALSLAGPAQSHPVSAVGGGIEQASAQKSGKASGGQAEQVGENAADLYVEQALAFVKSSPRPAK